MSGVADSSKTLTEAGTIDGAQVSIPLAGNQPTDHLAGQSQAARALVASRAA